VELNENDLGFNVVSYKRSRWPKKTASQIEKETVYYRAKTPRRQDYLSFKSFPLRALRLCAR
jgi:hypothetical protein